jgi:PHD/YefM family antitoxin component YafN of YafNO toxin-antitoxin module
MEISMNVITINQANTKLPYLINQVADSHQPILITVPEKNASSFLKKIAIEETLYLLSIPGMRESIKEGLQTPIEECSKDLKW